MHINEENIEILNKFKELKELNLSRCNISDIKVLEKVKFLISLSFWDLFYLLILNFKLFLYVQSFLEKIKKLLIKEKKIIITIMIIILK